MLKFPAFAKWQTVGIKKIKKYKKLKTEKIYDENGRSFTRIFLDDKLERINPVEYYKTDEIERRAIVIRDLLYSKNSLMTSAIGEEWFIEKAKEGLDEFIEKIEQTKVHENFIKLLDTTKKKDQVNLLKNMSLNTDELLVLIFKSYNDFGYLYSKYRFDNLPNGLEGKILPKLFKTNDDGTIYKVGKTDLTDGELKNLIEHRKVIVSHFFEKDDFWHCFFLTFNSIGGKEAWKDGQAHFHYISRSFGVSKDDFIDSMRTGKYKSTSIHIDLIDYGNQTI